MYTEVHCSTPPRMAVVPNSSKFFDRKTCRADFDTEINSERTRMSVVPSKSEFALANSSSKSVHGCTLLDTVRDRSGILFSAAILQRQPSTRGEALRDCARSAKKIQADSPTVIIFRVVMAENDYRNAQIPFLTITELTEAYRK